MYDWTLANPNQQQYDTITCTALDSKTLKFTYKKGGPTGDVVTTLTIAYVDDTPPPFDFVVRS